MELPKKVVIDKKYSKKEYTLVKQYKHYGLYEDEKGFRECFDPFDLGLYKRGSEV